MLPELTFRREKADAEQAIATMNGEWLGSRAIRVNWANQKTQTGGRGGPGGFGGSSMGGSGGMGGMTPGASSIPPAPGVAMPMAPSYPTGGQDYETVVAQTPAYNTTVYVGNLIPYSTQADLYPLFQVSWPKRRGKAADPVSGLRLHCRDPNASRSRLRLC